MIVIDTHIWIWLAAEPEKLTAAARDAILGAKEIGVPAISLWEISMLEERGRITLSLPRLQWFDLYLSSGRFRLLPLTPAFADKSVSLNMHADPADRLIAATALLNERVLVTADHKIIASGVVRTVW